MVRTDRIQLQYKLTFTTPFHCGAGLSSGIIDRTVVRNAYGSLYVPGSTFKGVVRTRCEQLARLYTFGSDGETRERIGSPHDKKQALMALRSPVTMIARIFGSRNRPGLLAFDDAQQVEQERRESAGKRKVENGDGDTIEQTDLQIQVRLDRQTRTALRDAFYASEFGLKALAFYGSISGWLNCTAIEGIKGEPSYSLLLLLAGLYMLDQVGGNKSTGKGQCTCEITTLAMNNLEFPSEIWQSWLEHLDMLMFYSENAEGQEEEE